MRAFCIFSLVLCLIFIFSQANDHHHHQCHFYNNEQTCIQSDEHGIPCEWCESSAVPSVCYNEKEAQKLPSGVFTCKKRQNLTKPTHYKCHYYDTKSSCLNNTSPAGGKCYWCSSSAVPSVCYNEAESKRLPPGVFDCIHSEKNLEFHPDLFELTKIPNLIELKNLFIQWIKYYSKNYESEFERIVRFNTFMMNAEHVANHNSNPKKTYTLTMTEFADTTWNEFKTFYLGAIPQNCSATHKQRLSIQENEIPHSIDWREQGIVSHVKNQGKCGSCWTFSSTGCLESHNMKKTQKMVLLSEQNLLDCAGNFDTHGCSGGLPSHAFEYIKYNGGLDTESSYPYHAKAGKCNFSSQSIGIKVIDVFNVSSMDENELKKAVGSVGPVSIAFQVDGNFRLYKHGVYESKTCKNGEKDVNHAVLAVGYNTDANGKDYWIVKNSWGPKWGNNGYFHIVRGKNMCGLADCASYPIV